MAISPPDTSTCVTCGMPLAYDRFVTDQPDQPVSTGSAELCSFCAASRKGGRKSAVIKNPDRRWVLDLILRTYQQDRRPVQRLVKEMARLLHVLPDNVSALADILATVPEKRATSKADAVVLYSGGKDSSWMLMDLARRDIKVVAWMLNQGYQSPTAIDNAQKLCDRLGIELVIARPSKKPMDDLFRLGFSANESGDKDLVRSAMTYGSACWPCFATIAANATVFCYDNDIPFCFIGTQAGQNRLDLHGKPVIAGGGLPSVDSLVDKFVSRLRDHAVVAAPDSVGLLESAPCRAVLVPFYEMVKKPSVDEQIRQLEQAGWKMPHNTGACSTNCMMNELGRKIMRKEYGFDLYQVIDANERRLDRVPAPSPVAVLDEVAVHRGAKLIDITPVEAKRFGLEKES